MLDYGFKINHGKSMEMKKKKHRFKNISHDNDRGHQEGL